MFRDAFQFTTGVQSAYLSLFILHSSALSSPRCFKVRPLCSLDSFAFSHDSVQTLKQWSVTLVLEISFPADIISNTSILIYIYIYFYGIWQTFLSSYHFLEVLSIKYPADLTHKLAQENSFPHSDV